MSRGGDAGERARRMAEWRATKSVKLEALMQTGSKVLLREPHSCTYRLTTPNGTEIDFWGTTGTWMLVGDYKDRGRGIESLLEKIGSAPQAREVEIKRSGATVTIFTDASLCGETGAAGWGCWIKFDATPGLTEGGELPGIWSTSCQAEIEALRYAIRLSIERGIVRDGMAVMLQSDSLEALSHIRWCTGARDSMVYKGHPVTMPKRVKPQNKDSGALDYIRSVQRALDLTFTVRHVKGHAGHDNSRHTVNRLCDRLAKTAMRKRRADLKAGPLCIGS